MKHFHEASVAEREPKPNRKYFGSERLEYRRTGVGLSRDFKRDCVRWTISGTTGRIRPVNEIPRWRQARRLSYAQIAVEEAIALRRAWACFERLVNTIET